MTVYVTVLPALTGAPSRLPPAVRHGAVRPRFAAGRSPYRQPGTFVRRMVGDAHGHGHRARRGRRGGLADLRPAAAVLRAPGGPAVPDDAAAGRRGLHLHPGPLAAAPHAPATFAPRPDLARRLAVPGHPGGPDGHRHPGHPLVAPGGAPAAHLAGAGLDRDPGPVRRCAVRPPLVGRGRPARWSAATAAARI